MAAHDVRQVDPFAPVGTPPLVLRADVADLLRDVLADGPIPPRPGTLRDAIAALYRDSRTRAVDAVDLIVALKQVWNTLPAVQALEPGEQRDEALAGVVSLCIEEFYAITGERG